MSLTLAQTVGLLVSILGIAGLAIYSGTKPQSFANDSRAPIIAGIIMGTLVGGSSTVGTAQLAYTYGMSAWWFTLGGGIACLVLALVYTVPLRHSGCMTLVGIIRKEFGPGAGLAASVLNSVGTFINIISQLIAGTAVIAVVAPSLGLIPALIITAAFMALYVVFGGTQGAGRVGILKLVLLYVSMIGCGVMVLAMAGGLSGVRAMVAGIDNPEGVSFWNLFARGVGKDGGACLSLILGVLTTQTYAQAVLSGRSDKAARTGALVSAVLVPPIGIGGILVGLYMRANYPGIVAKTALTAFATTHLPGLLCGLVLGTLFIAVVGTGAGLAMGISTIVRRDILPHFSDTQISPAKSVNLSRAIIVAVLALGVCLSSGSLGDTILSFAFMSMGLRGAVVFVPLCCALWLPGKVSHGWAMAGIILGPVVVLLCGTVLPLPGGIDSLFAGIFAALVCCVLGLLAGRQHTPLHRLHKPALRSPRLVIAVDQELYCCGGDISRELARQLSIPCLAAEEAGRAQAAADSQVPYVLLDCFGGETVTPEDTVVRVFVHRSFDERAARFAETKQLGAAAARRQLRRQDRVYRHDCRHMTPHWGNPAAYTLWLDVTGVETDRAVETLLDGLDAVTGRPLPRAGKTE